MRGRLGRREKVDFHRFGRKATSSRAHTNEGNKRQNSPKKESLLLFEQIVCFSQAIVGGPAGPTQFFAEAMIACDRKSDAIRLWRDSRERESLDGQPVAWMVAWGLRDPHERPQNPVRNPEHLQRPLVFDRNFSKCGTAEDTCFRCRFREKRAHAKGRTHTFGGEKGLFLETLVQPTSRRPNSSPSGPLCLSRNSLYE